MALNGIKTLQARLERLEQKLLPPEPLLISVEFRAIDGYGRVVEHFAPSLEVEPDLVLRIAPHDHFTL